MTAQHAIVIFPAFAAAEQIESVRQDFDPLATLLPAHVTLVFPFADILEPASLREHVIAAAERTPPFDIAAAAPTAEDDGYLFLRITDGRETIVALHDRLYTGILRTHLSLAHAYDPHVTVGRVGSREALDAATATARSRLVSPLRARVDSVSIFRLDQGAGTVVSVIPLTS